MYGLENMTIELHDNIRIFLTKRNNTLEEDKIEFSWLGENSSLSFSIDKPEMLAVLRAFGWI